MASSTYTGALYGTGTYGSASYGITNVAVVPDGSQASATADTDIIISGDALHNITSVVGVAVNGGIGAVTADGTASLAAVSVEATGEIGDITHLTVNRVPVTGVAATPAVDDVVIVAESLLTLPSTSSTVSVGSPVVTAGSVFAVTGVSATGEVEEDETVLNNAIPTFTGVSASIVFGNISISATQNVFDVANRSALRATAKVPPAEPRIIYIGRAA